jgi:hypothetical protein
LSLFTDELGLVHADGHERAVGTRRSGYERPAACCHAIGKWIADATRDGTGGLTVISRIGVLRARVSE